MLLQTASAVMTTSCGGNAVVELSMLFACVLMCCGG